MDFLDRRIYRNKMIDCSLCYDAPCTAVCGKLDPAKLLRSVWFDNERTAAASLPEFLESAPCVRCRTKCEWVCTQRVHIRRVIEDLAWLKNEKLDITPDMSRLRTTFLGFELENPFLLSSSIISGTYEKVARAFDSGWAGAAMKTISTMEMHEASPRYAAIRGDSNTINGFKNIEQLSELSVEENLKIFRKLKKNYPHKYLLVSIMGRNDAEWADLAKRSEEAGADALELNFSCPNMVEEDTGSDVGQSPKLVEHFTRVVREAVKIPVIAKLTPNVESMTEAAEAAVRGGADGIAAINTIKSVITGNDSKVAVGGLSGNAVKPVALRFIAEMGANHKLMPARFTGMGGIETWRDALEFIGYGCGTVQITTAVMQYGIRIIEDLTAGLAAFLTVNNTTVHEVEGYLIRQTVDTAEMERDTVIYPKFLPDRCGGCGRCYISCRDGGHEALEFDKDRRPVLDPKKCVGCHLCILVCPENAIISSGKAVKKERN